MRWPRRIPVCCFLAACAIPAVAGAQATAGNVQLNQYQPTPFSDRILRADGGAVQPFGQFRVGVDLDYAFRPLVLHEKGPGIFQAGTSPDHNLVAHAVGGTLVASVGLPFRLEAGLALPLTLWQSGESVAGAIDPSIAGVGNARLGLKARLLDWRGLAAGAAILAAIPAGVGTLTHEGGFGAEGRLFAGYQRGRLSVAARGGFRLRGQQSFYDIALGNELTFATGVTFQAATRTTALAELSGATAVGAPFGNARQTPVEALLGVRQRIGKTWFTLAGGPGLVEGYGSPVFRVVAGFTWANRPPDADGDGISDDDDRCPDIPEDRDGFEDADGCPDPDNDKDGILDAADKCPDAAEDKDGFEDADGCPDPDNDKDGILDAADKCPAQPETANDFEDDDGCPDENPPASDKDNDGFPDDVDECPEEPEDKDGFEDDDGCPEPDNDKDGIPDASDKCPLEPETINGIDDEDGCPDKGKGQVRLGKTEIETLQPIYFDTDRSRVRHAFYNTLGQIASLLKAHTEIGRCAIEGHTDDTGPPDWNNKLSVLRAESVIEFLVLRGVDPERLVAIGHGEDLPWASNETPEGRAKNRRVVFHIEGVNPAEEKKQELRQERRRRIRHQREQSEQQGQKPERKSDEKSDKKSDEKSDKKSDEKSDKKSDEKSVDKPGDKPGDKTNQKQNQRPEKPALKEDRPQERKQDGKQDPKELGKATIDDNTRKTTGGPTKTAAPKTAPPTTAPVPAVKVGPTNGPTAVPGTGAAASSSQSTKKVPALTTDSAPSPGTKKPPAAASAATGDEQEEPPEPTAKNTVVPRPGRTPRKSTPDSPPKGIPPTLRDLLKLPPR